VAWLLAILLSFSLVAAACGDDDSDDDTSAGDDAGSDDDAGDDTGDDTGDDAGDDMGDDTGDMGDLSGEIFISGSSTVEPVSVRVQEMFNDTYPDVNIAVDGPGTGDGFALFCDGETDISDASRAIKDEEAATCEANGVNYVELQVGIDGLAVMTSEANDAVECVSFADLYALTGPESTGFGSWADANDLSAELGGAGSLPDAPLDIFGPGEESGTYDTYVEFIVEEFSEDRVQASETRPDYNPSADDNVIVSGITGSDTSLGWVGFAFAANASGVKMLEVEHEDSGCVAPTAETIASGEYPLSRPLFIYVNTDKAAESEALTAYVDFYMADGLDTAVAEVDYVELADDAKAETRAAWAG
jgi:phosphate transport system substrate-binding protein